MTIEKVIHIGDEVSCCGLPIGNYIFSLTIEEAYQFKLKKQKKELCKKCIKQIVKTLEKEYYE